MDKLLVNSNVSYQLPVLDIDDNDKGPNLQEEVLAVEDDS
jgi:hypothetical protein